ncbi:MAG: response regulator, partial [Pseudomonadota bacterium]|nr:response regulator [Pseudomonadota bacterium]
LMTAEPLVVEADASVEDFRREMLAERPGELMRGFVLTQGGRYLGVGTALCLLQAANKAADRQAEQAAQAAERLAQAEAAAEAATRAKGQFLSVMSHEMRTPLIGVLAVAELLQRQPLRADGRAYVRTIVESSERLMRLLSDAVDLSRADAEGLDLAVQPTSLRDLMDQVQALWLARACEDGVGLSVTYSGEPGLTAELDPVRLKQVFSNLIGNALKSTRRGGVEAGLEASREGGRLRLRGHVRDTGPGLEPWQLSEIFEPFVGGRPRGGDGAGLGLAICRRVLEAMGGRIWAENNAGAGAVLRFEFDAPACETQEETAEREQAEAAPTLGGRVLIVDDNATNRMVAQTLVEMFGCSVETAQDGVEAVEAVVRNDFDAILMDIRMPRMDGVDATRAIRALPGPERATPIIALTANVDPEDARRYLAAGMASVVEKPIKAERLLAALSEVLAPPGDPAVAAA